MKNLDSFGDNRRTKDTRRMKLFGLNACCMILFSYSISHNFLALKCWNVKLKRKRSVKNLDSQCPKRQASPGFCLTGAPLPEAPPPKTDDSYGSTSMPTSNEGTN